MKTAQLKGTRKLMTGERIPCVWHVIVIDEHFERAVFDGTTGFCIACGEEADGVEPDARRYKCEACSQMYVYGLEELVLKGFAKSQDEVDRILAKQEGK